MSLAGTVKPEKRICGMSNSGTNMTACIGDFAKADIVKPMPVAAKANRIKPDNLPLKSAVDTESADRDRRVKQERLDRSESGHPDKFAGQVAPAAQANQPFTAIDRLILLQSPVLNCCSRTTGSRYRRKIVPAAGRWLPRRPKLR